MSESSGGPSAQAAQATKSKPRDTDKAPWPPLMPELDRPLIVRKDKPNAVGELAGAMKDVVANNEEENAAESLTGGLAGSMLELVSATTKRVQSLINLAIRNREGTPLPDLDARERVATVTILREQRGEHLRHGPRQQGGLGDRLRRAGMKRERAQERGQAQRAGAGERRYRASAQQARSRTVDGGVLHGQRAPAPGRSQGSVLTLTDARRAIMVVPDASRSATRFAPGNRADGPQAARVGGPAVTQANGMRGALSRMPRLAGAQQPSQLRLAAPQTVNRAPSDAATRQPGMGVARGMAGVGNALGIGR